MFSGVRISGLLGCLGWYKNVTGTSGLLGVGLNVHLTLVYLKQKNVLRFWSVEEGIAILNQVGGVGTR